MEFNKQIINNKINTIMFNKYRTKMFNLKINQKTKTIVQKIRINWLRVKMTKNGKMSHMMIHICPKRNLMMKFLS